ncbi:hypothetical protein Tco_0206551 [Tanacetum coccineum]
MYWNNALHWLETENNQLTHYKRNIEYPDHPIITIIQIPQSLQQGRNFFKSYGNILPMIITIQIPHILHLEGKLFDLRGCLLLVRRDNFGSSKFTIYEMMKGSSVWSVREDDSFLVINLSGKVVEYNLISKNLQEMYDMGSYQLTDDYHNGFILPGFIPPFAMYDMRPKQDDHKNGSLSCVIGIGSCVLSIQCKCMDYYVTNVRYVLHVLRCDIVVWPSQVDYLRLAMPSHFHKKFRWGTVFATGHRSFIEPGTGLRMKRTNRRTRVPIGLYPCHIEEKMTIKEVKGESVMEWKTKVTTKEGVVIQFPGKFRGYKLTTEEEVEENEGLKEVWEKMEYVISDSDSDLESTASS